MDSQVASDEGRSAPGPERTSVPSPSSAPGAPTSPGAPTPSEAQWPARAADLVEAVVAGVHDRVVRPIILGARGLVFGLIISTMLLVGAVVSCIAVIRLLDVYAFGHRVWASDALVGALFSAAGLLAWSKRRTSSERS